MLTSEFSEKSLKSIQEASIKDIKQIICLGIGRVSECSIARHQLSLLAIIQQKLKIISAKIYDPVLSNYDKVILERLNFEILSENKEGKYSITTPTLFYLPHCPKQITNNLLFANWKPESLKNLILICNSFKSIIESTPERLLRPNAHFLLEINPFVTEIEIENCFRFKDIFNDFSLHIFDKKLDEIPENFWKDPIEPIYSSEDLEFVKNVGT